MEGLTDDFDDYDDAMHEATMMMGGVEELSFPDVLLLPQKPAQKPAQSPA